MATGAGARSPGGRRRVVVMGREGDVECLRDQSRRAEGGRGGDGGDGGDGGVWVGGGCDGVDELWWCCHPAGVSRLDARTPLLGGS